MRISAPITFGDSARQTASMLRRGSGTTIDPDQNIAPDRHASRGSHVAGAGSMRGGGSLHGALPAAGPGRESRACGSDAASGSITKLSSDTTMQCRVRVGELRVEIEAERGEEPHRNIEVPDREIDEAPAGHGISLCVRRFRSRRRSDRVLHRRRTPVARIDIPGLCLRAAGA
ncbi:hypothetical protein [Luteimonas sp. A482]